MDKTDEVSDTLEEAKARLDEHDKKSKQLKLKLEDYKNRALRTNL